LRSLRKELAQTEAVPVYTLFTNEQLAQMVQRRYQSKSDLGQIEGVGDGALQGIRGESPARRVQARGYPAHTFGCDLPRLSDLAHPCGTGSKKQTSLATAGSGPGAGGAPGIPQRTGSPAAAVSPGGIFEGGLCEELDISSRCVARGPGGRSLTSSNRVNRGGAWNNDAANCRMANRNTNDPTNRTTNSGFRLALNSARRAKNGPESPGRNRSSSRLAGRGFGWRKLNLSRRGAGSRSDDRVERSARAFHALA
jgi:HRDC domain